MAIQHFRDIRVWQKAHQLTLAVYGITSHFPRSEQFGLISQIRRCSVSVPSNIAEGCTRTSKKERIHFYSIARASLEELKYQLLLSCDLQYMSQESYDKIFLRADEVGKMLYAWQKSQQTFDY